MLEKLPKFAIIFRNQYFKHNSSSYCKLSSRSRITNGIYNYIYFDGFYYISANSTLIKHNINNC